MSSRLVAPRRSARGARRWLVLGVLVVPVFMTAIDLSVLFLALPSIAADLAPTATQQLWTLHIGDLLSAGLVLTVGAFADRIGPRRLLMIGMAAYGAFSLIAAHAPNPETLIVARGLIGIAAVTVGPSSLVLLRHAFPEPREFTTALATFMAAFSGGTAFGPPFGGFLLEHFGWGAVFLANVPVTIFVALALPWLPSVPGTGAGKVDGASIALSLVAVATAVYALQAFAAHGGHWSQAALITVGIAAGATFVRRQLRLAAPLFDMRLFAHRGFRVSLVVLFSFLVAATACYMQIAQYLQTVVGLSPLHAGVVLAVPAGVQVGATALAPKLLGWMRPAHALALGGALAAVGTLTVLAGTLASPSMMLPTIVVGEAIMAMGSGPIFAIGASLIMSSVPMDKTGSAAGIQEVSGSLGATMGLATGGSLAVVAYQATLGAAMPAGVPHDLAEQASHSVGRAVAAAQTLEPAMARSLSEAAQDAFATATRLVYGLAAILVFGLAGLVVRAQAYLKLADAPGRDDGDDVAHVPAA